MAQSTKGWCLHGPPSKRHLWVYAIYSESTVSICHLWGKSSVSEKFNSYDLGSNQSWQVFGNKGRATKIVSGDQYLWSRIASTEPTYRFGKCSLPIRIAKDPDQQWGYAITHGAGFDLGFDQMAGLEGRSKASLQVLECCLPNLAIEIL